MKTEVKQIYFVIVLMLLLYAMYSLVLRLGILSPAPPLLTFKDMVGRTFIALVVAAAVIVYLNYVKND